MRCTLAITLLWGDDLATSGAAVRVLKSLPNGGQS